jgi:hypothetical protein
MDESINEKIDNHPWSHNYKDTHLDIILGGLIFFGCMILSPLVVTLSFMVVVIERITKY